MYTDVSSATRSAILYLTTENGTVRHHKAGIFIKTEIHFLVIVFRNVYIYIGIIDESTYLGVDVMFSFSSV